MRSSTDRSMSVTSGGVAAKGLSAGGRSAGSAGAAGVVMTFSAFHSAPSRNQRHTDADRSAGGTTTPTKPQVAAGSCGRSEEHTSEIQSRQKIVFRLLLVKKKNYQ